MAKGNKSFETVSDDQVISLIEQGVASSVGDWLNSSDLAVERQRSTYEYAGVAAGHLTPNGVSSIVDTSTTEVIEAYIAVLSELFLNNGKLARFTPIDDQPGSFKASRDASMITNYAIFKQNKGWEQIQTWMKSALLWKNGIIRWDFVEDFSYRIEEYDRIDQAKLDLLLADENVEIVGDLQFENELSEMDAMGAGGFAELVYLDVRLRRKKDKSRVKVTNIPPENFRIARDAISIEEAAFVGIQTDMTRSDIRKSWPEVAENIEDWDELGVDTNWGMTTSQDVAARKLVTGQGIYNSTPDDMTIEANREVTVTECWIPVDRDGDGVSELKHFIVVGTHILFEEDVDDVPLASLSPIDIPFEFYGMSMADFSRSSTLASTAILRGFVENTYLTNYSPKLADPNVVDFSALQNMKPKQIIATNGNPNGAVAQLPPEAISTGTVPLLQHLQLVKEQATGMSKAAQGLQDDLYVSGNSESKIAQVQSASQKRIQHIARRFAETGLKRFIQGVYNTMRDNMQTNVKYMDGSTFRDVDVQSLPRDMECEIFLDLGENSNANLIAKYGQIGSQILPALASSGAGAVVKPTAAAAIATRVIEALGLDASDFLEDYTTDEFKAKAEEQMTQSSESAAKVQAIEERKVQADIGLAEANVAFTLSQTKNTMEDNGRALTIMLDKHHQEWADITIKAGKEGVSLPENPSIEQLLMMSKEIMDRVAQMEGPQEQAAPTEQQSFEQPNQ